MEDNKQNNDIGDKQEKSDPIKMISDGLLAGQNMLSNLTDAQKKALGIEPYGDLVPKHVIARQTPPDFSEIAKNRPPGIEQVVRELQEIKVLLRSIDSKLS